jgi:putative peptidoglycan lipid II flippase
VAVPMMAATRRLRGSAAVAGVGHAAFAGIAAAAAGGAVGLAVTTVMPTGGAILEVCAGAVSTLLAIVVFGAVAYVLDKKDVRAAAGRLRRYAQSRT